MYLQTLENTLFTQSDLSDISRVTRINYIQEQYPTMEKTISEFSATSRGLLAKVAPFATKGSHLLNVLLNYNDTNSIHTTTVHLYPASIICWHIALPMTPVPTQPTRVVLGVAEATRKSDKIQNYYRNV